MEYHSDKRDGKVLSIILETRRVDLKPEVRRYADRLYVDIKKLHTTYGAKKAAELYAKVKARQISVLFLPYQVFNEVVDD